MSSAWNLDWRETVNSCLLIPDCSVLNLVLRAIMKPNVFWVQNPNLIIRFYPSCQLWPDCITAVYNMALLILPLDGAAVWKLLYSTLFLNFSFECWTQQAEFILSFKSFTLPLKKTPQTFTRLKSFTFFDDVTL